METLRKWKWKNVESQRWPGFNAISRWDYFIRWSIAHQYHRMCRFLSFLWRIILRSTVVVVVDVLLRFIFFHFSVSPSFDYLPSMKCQSGGASIGWVQLAFWRLKCWRKKNKEICVALSLHNSIYLQTDSPSPFSHSNWGGVLLSHHESYY